MKLSFIFHLFFYLSTFSLYSYTVTFRDDHLRQLATSFCVLDQSMLTFIEGRTPYKEHFIFCTLWKMFSFVDITIAWPRIFVNTFLQNILNF